MPWVMLLDIGDRCFDSEDADEVAAFVEKSLIGAFDKWGEAEAELRALTCM